MLSGLLAISPVFVAVAVILLGRRAPLWGATAGLAAALALALLLEGAGLTQARAATALQTTGIVTLAAALVIGPGLLLNMTLARQGATQRIVDGLVALDMAAERRAVVLVLGLLPAIECVTGFGVALLLSVPALCRLAGPERGLRLAILAMFIMPFGALALPTTVGAALIGFPPAVLGAATVAYSLPALCVFALAALLTFGGLATLRRSGGFALALALLLAAGLFLNCRFLFVETAGVFAGLAVAAAGFGWEAAFGRLRFAGPAARRGLAALAPFGCAALLIVAARGWPPAFEALSGALRLAGVRLALQPLTSPGLALLVVALGLLALKPVRLDLGLLARSAARPIATVFAFVLLAQTMRETGLLDLAVAAADGLAPAALASLGVAAAVLSGFATGSGVAGNALMMSAQYELGASVGRAVDFAALQNAGAGHSSFASPPIVAVARAVAQTAGEGAVADAPLIRFGLTVVAAVLVALLLAAAVLQGA
jgi:lactate permease